MTETLQTLGTFERVLFLRQVPLFNNLTPEDLQQIAEVASERVIPSHEHLCREGDIGGEMFVIVDGEVQVMRKSGDGTRMLRTLKVGDHVGELAILRKQPRSASVVAGTNDVRVLVIHGDALRAILRDRPEVAMSMLRSLAERLSTVR